MSPAISFSMFKDKILSGEKAQTIRPLFKNVQMGNTFRGKKVLKHPDKDVIVPRKPRCKVGDTLYLYWKMQSKKVWEDIKNSSEAEKIYRKLFLEWTNSKQNLVEDFSVFSTKRGLRDKPIDIQKESAIMQKQIDGSQLLKVAKCTERFEVEMRRKSAIWWIEGALQTDLAKRDGFKNSTEMFEWFHKKYNLSEPKRFEVIRWK